MVQHKIYYRPEVVIYEISYEGLLAASTWSSANSFSTDEVHTIFEEEL